MAQVIIRNKLRQLVSTTLIQNGKVVSLKLGPSASSAPLDSATISPHTHRLAERGFVKISPAT